MVAAIAAARGGAYVTIYERNDRLGKKILATGNGKCNLGNLNLSSLDYYSGNLHMLESILEKFGTQDTIRFFESIGLMIKEKNGYLYPQSEQASAVLDVLRLGVERHHVEIRYQTKVTGLVPKGQGFLIVTGDGNVCHDFYDRVILACGSKAAPKTGSDGSGYKIARKMGIRVSGVVPALVQLRCQESYLKGVAGVRADACVHIYRNHQEITKERGELLLTEYGISGIPVFQLSGCVNRILYQEPKTAGLRAEIDFLPDISNEEWIVYGKQRIRNASQDNLVTVEDFFTGMLNKKLMMLFIKQAGLKSNAPVSQVAEEQLLQVFMQCKKFVLCITGSMSYDSAQVCSGGVSLHEVTEDLEAVDIKGLYFAGELLDVDGRCGGYNLQWAWASGYLSGSAAARKE